MTFSRRRGLAAGLVLGAAALFSSISPQAARAAYPEKPVTVIVAWGAGGATDLVTRALQATLAKKLGTDIVIKNVPGAAGTIGTAEVAKSKPDGYTILITPAGPLTTQPHRNKLPYDLPSFAGVGRIAVTPMLMMVTKKSKFKTLADIIKEAKANPGKVKFSSTGAGTLPHISIVALNDMAKIDTKHVPFKGSADVMKALLGGVVDVFSDQAQLVPKYDLHAVACWSAKRLPEYPSVPTMKELGYDLVLENWLGVFVPKATPAAIVAKIEKAVADTVKDAKVVESLQKLKVVPAYMTAKELDVFAKAEYGRNRELLKKAGLLKK
ncbi:MAG: tripartite tricarboxylate transporter substrate binding protein [Hyphomicrobiaceae bacterium]